MWLRQTPNFLDITLDDDSLQTIIELRQHLYEAKQTIAFEGYRRTFAEHDISHTVPLFLVQSPEERALLFQGELRGSLLTPPSPLPVPVSGYLVTNGLVFGEEQQPTQIEHLLYSGEYVSSAMQSQISRRSTFQALYDAALVGDFYRGSYTLLPKIRGVDDAVKDMRLVSGKVGTICLRR
jgi:hypothetical protein